MFGYYYHDPRRPDPGDVFGSFFTFLVIFGILFAVAFYFGSIVLMIFLGIGALIGLIYAVIVYIQSFVDACRSLGGISGRNGLTSILLKWWHLFKNASINAFKSNLSVAHSAIIKAGGYRFLSFKKWMWFIVAPTVLVFGTAMIAFVAFLQLLLLFFILQIVLTIFLAACIIYLVIAIGYAIGKVGHGLINAFSISNPFSSLDFSRYFLFSDLGRFTKEYFSSLIRIVVELWNAGISLISTNFSTAKGYSAFNVIRYFLFITPVAIIPITVLFIALIFIVMPIVYIPLFIAELVWALIVKIIK